jgi:hypothetical protein
MTEIHKVGIVFENIDTHDSILITREGEGKHYRAKLSAAINSSNLHANADRGQDFGWRLVPEQQAVIEQWEEDPDMIDKVANFTKVPVDSMSHSDFLSYLLYQQELGKSPERSQDAQRRENQTEYEQRVAALRESNRPVPMKEFDAARIENPTVEDFLSGALTGDAGGDKVEEESSSEDGSSEDTSEPDITGGEPVSVEPIVTMSPMAPKTRRKRS